MFHCAGRAPCEHPPRRRSARARRASSLRTKFPRTQLPRAVREAPCSPPGRWATTPAGGERETAATPLAENPDPALFVRRFVSAPLAQLDRASASGAEGHRFESCVAREVFEDRLRKPARSVLGFGATRTATRRGSKPRSPTSPGKAAQAAELSPGTFHPAFCSRVTSTGAARRGRWAPPSVAEREDRRPWRRRLRREPRVGGSRARPDERARRRSRRRSRWTWDAQSIKAAAYGGEAIWRRCSGRPMATRCTRSLTAPSPSPKRRRRGTTMLAGTCSAKS
jgi:hypothetical protein